MAALVLGLVLRIEPAGVAGPARALGALVAAGAVGRGAAVALMATTPSGPTRMGSARRTCGRWAAAPSPPGCWPRWRCGRRRPGRLGRRGGCVGRARPSRWSCAGWRSAKIGGLVGDVLGAAEQLAELAVLVAAVAVVRAARRGLVAAMTDEWTTP